MWRTRLRGSGTRRSTRASAADRLRRRRLRQHRRQRRVRAVDRHRRDPLAVRIAKLDPNITSVCCGWNNKGVAISEDKVFIGQLDGQARGARSRDRQGRVVDQAERWQENFSITPRRSTSTAWSSSASPAAIAARAGRVKAYDAKDGRLIWTFYTIPGPGEPGHDTWPKDNDAWKYGGAAIWQTPAVDPELGLVYFSTGNAAPDYNGAFRAGDNLYAASILAIELATGKYRWHFQQVHHDIWDYDAVNPVVLMDVNIGGRTRKAIVEVGKTGWAYILDRETGKPLIGIDEKPVPQEPRQATAATQPFPRGDAIVPQLIEIAPEGHALVNDGRIFTPFVGDDPTIVAPGIWGGANWPPSAYDPGAAAAVRLRLVGDQRLHRRRRSEVRPADRQSRTLGGATTFTRRAPASSRRST